MKPFNSIRLSVILGCLFLVTVLIAPQVIHAATWQALVGTQSKDLARQGWRFYPMSSGFMLAIASPGHLPRMKFTP
jgi:hypothetical protein